MSMHFSVFVVTKEQPNKHLINQALRPFHEKEWTTAQIGGRWTGYFTDYDPIKDPDNNVKCEACDNTGVEVPIKELMKLKPKSQEDRPRVRACEHCQGMRFRVKRVEDWHPHEGDSQLVENVSIHCKPSVIVYEDKWIDVVPYHEFIANIPLNYWVTVVDCTK